MRQKGKEKARARVRKRGKEGREKKVEHKD